MYYQKTVRGALEKNNSIGYFSGVWDILDVD